MFAPNRIAVYLTIIASIAGGLAPVIADMDWSSTGGIIAAVLAIAAVVRKWLDGWQLYEADMRGAELAPEPRLRATSYHDVL
jgi:hypothetical protein